MFSRRFFDAHTTFSLPTSAARLKHDDTSRDMQMYTVRITGNLNLHGNINNSSFYILCVCKYNYVKVYMYILAV